MWCFYKKTAEQEMRPYATGEDLKGISVIEQDTPELGGMIARNSENHEDQWYVAKDFFEKNYALSQGETLSERGVACDKFVSHIEEHLTPGQQVMCKICDNTFDEVVYGN